MARNSSSSRRRPRGRPRNDADDRPSADGILECAERVFAANGFGNTSLRTLIEASQMSTTAFYARFASKDDVLAALLLRLMTSVGEAFMATAPHATSMRDGFDIGIDLVVDALTRHRAIARVALGEGAGCDAVRETLLDGYKLLAEKVDGPDHDVAWAVVGALHMQVVRWAVFDEIDDDGLRRSLRTTAKTLLPPPA